MVKFPRGEGKNEREGKDMKDQTFGVEIEMNNIRRDNAAKIAADFFGTGRYEYTALVDGYATWSAWDAQGRKWKFQRDVSINGPEAEKCEMVTPILKYEDMETLQELVRRLRHAGAKSDDMRGCGVHIHIGADGHDAKTLRHLANMMYSHEELLIPALRLSRRRMDDYCRPVDENFIRRLNAEKPKTMAELADVWYESQGCTYGRDQHYNNSRYHMLNLHATFTKGTIEFRLFQFDRPGRRYKGGLHAGKLKAYIQFCLAISDAAKKAKGSRPVKTQTDNPKYAMTGWLCRMGLTGDEFKTLRKVFNDNLTGNAARRYVA
jgi:hypothetical protein